MKKIFSFFALVLVFMISARGGEPNKGYRGYVDFALGDAYNLNTAQTISNNNMQLYGMVSTAHGYYLKNWFIGVGVGYYYSCRDIENMYPLFIVSRYTVRIIEMKPSVEVRFGIMYDPLWVEKVQNYSALSFGVDIFKRLQLNLRMSVFSRPSRYFTANAAVVLSYVIGK